MRLLPLGVVLLAVTALLPAPADATSYPGAAWSAAASCNYTNSNREASYDINTVVIHTAEGSYSGTISWFKNCAAAASAHYVVAKDGRIAAMVADEDIAWHAGDWVTNTHSIGIEHEGYTYTCCYTETQYVESAKLTRWLADRYGVPLDRTHIIGHSQVPGCPSGNGGGSSCHTDPGPYWDWNHYMDLVRGNGADTTPPSVPSLAEDACGSAWTRTSTCHWMWSSSDPESGIAQYEVQPSWSGAFTTGAQGWRPTLGTGSFWVKVRAQNTAGLWSGWSGAVAVNVDVTPPNAPSISTPRSNAWSNDNTPTITWTNPGDAGSGVARYDRILDGAVGNVGNVLSNTPSLADGTHTYALRAVDGVAWSSATSNTLTLRIDTTPPITSLAPGAPNVPTSDGAWVTSSTQVALDARDALSGVATTTLNGAAYAGAATLEGGDGARAWSFRSTDGAGNAEAARTATLHLDNTPPALVLDAPGDGQLIATTQASHIAGSASDAGVGVDRIEVRIDGATRAVVPGPAFDVAWQPGDEHAGPHLVEVVAFDRLGNAAVQQASVTTVPTSFAGVQATAAWIAGWPDAPPVLGVRVGCTELPHCTAGVTIDGAFLGARA